MATIEVDDIFRRSKNAKNKGKSSYLGKKKRSLKNSQSDEEYREKQSQESPFGNSKIKEMRYEKSKRDSSFETPKSKDKTSRKPNRKENTVENPNSFGSQATASNHSQDAKAHKSRKNAKSGKSSKKYLEVQKDKTTIPLKENSFSNKATSSNILPSPMESVPKPIYKPPRNCYGRKYSPPSAANVLLTENPDKSITGQQFLDPGNSFYRELTLIPKEQDLPEDSSVGTEQKMEIDIDRTPKKLADNSDFGSRSASFNGDNGEIESLSFDDSPGSSSEDSSSGSESPPTLPTPSPFRSTSTGKREFPFLAFSPNGREYTSARHVEIQLEAQQKRSFLFFLSPDRPPTVLPKGNSKQSRKRKLDINTLEESLSSQNSTSIETTKRTSKYRSATPTKMETSSQETKMEITSSSNNSKGGSTYILTDYQRNRKKAKSQKTVMGKTANQEMQEAIDKLDVLLVEKSKKASEELKMALDTNPYNFDKTTIQLMKMLADNFSIEWLHCLGFSISPEDFDPQTVANLGSGPAWINTQMMPLEKLAKHFAQLYPGLVKLTPTFSMLPNTDVIDEITFDVWISVPDRGSVLVRSEKIKALALPNRSNWVSSSDGPQTIRVVHGLLNPESVNGLKIVSSHFPRFAI